MMRRPFIILIIALFVSIVIGVVGYFVFVAPKNAQVDEVQKDIEATENEIRAEEASLKQLEKMKEDAATYEARLASVQAMIPTEPDLPGLIRSIQAAADPDTGAGLPWLSFSPTEIYTSTTSTGTGGAAYSEYSFNMSCAGFYDEVVDLIYRMERFQRQVVLESVAMTPTSNILTINYSPNLGLVQCQLTAKTFTFAQPSQTGTTTTVPTTPTPTPETGTEG